MTSATVPVRQRESVDLEAIAGRIDELHAQCEAAVHDGLNRAAEAGRLLLSAKSEIPHGQWLTWLSTETRLSERAAQAYMRVARMAGELQSKSATGVADLSFRKALMLLASPQEGDGRSADRGRPQESDRPSDAALPPSRPSATAPSPTMPPAAPVTVPVAAEPCPPAEPTTRDEVGQPIPLALQDAFAARERFDRALTLLRELTEVLNPLLGDANGLDPAPGGEELAIVRQQVLADVKNLRSAITARRPFALCPYPHGRHGCRECHGLGWVRQSAYKSAPSEYRKGEAA